MLKKIKIELVYSRFTDSYEIERLVNIAHFTTRCNGDSHEINDLLHKREVVEITEDSRYEVTITGEK
jgi:hypothetical protein